MIVVLTILTANYLPWAILIGLLFAAGLCLSIVGNIWWSLLRRVGYDLLAFVANYRTNNDRANERRVKLRVWELQARAQIQDRRLMLQSGNAAAAGVKLFDIIIEDQ